MTDITITYTTTYSGVHRQRFESDDKGITTQQLISLLGTLPPQAHIEKIDKTPRGTTVAPVVTIERLDGGKADVILENNTGRIKFPLKDNSNIKFDISDYLPDNEYMFPDSFRMYQPTDADMTITFPTAQETTED